VAKVSLSISGVSEDMSSEEVRQKLARLYDKPEQKFEKLCQSLFIMQQPYVLLKDVEQAVADKHAQRLTALGFSCDFGDGGLDEKLQKQLQSASNSHERIQKFQAEQAAKHKEDAKAKQQAKLARRQKQKPIQESEEPEEAVADTGGETEFKATYKEKRNLALPAAFAATAIVVGGGGYLGYDYISNRYVSDAPDAMASIVIEPQPELTSEVLAASIPANGSAGTVAADDAIEVSETTLFDQWSDRKSAEHTLKQQIHELIEENMLASASGLVAGKTDPRDQIYGRQELIKSQGQSEDTDRKLLSTYMLVLALEDDAERVSATLNQSSIYRLFNRHEDATKTYDQAAKIAAAIKDVEQRIVSETAIAEHQVEHGNLDGARARYQAAKDRTEELSAQPKLESAAFAYIATSEVAHGLTADAETTAELITDSETRANSQQSISDIVTQNKAAGVPELAASLSSDERDGSEDSDELIKDLIKINEQNRKKMKAAANFLGQ